MQAKRYCVAVAVVVALGAAWAFSYSAGSVQKEPPGQRALGASADYEELLGRDPQAAGKVVLSFAIVGDGDAGVVDRVELKDDTTMQDPEFTLCMRESMYTAVFEAPPPGASETTVEYPLELSP